MTAQVEPSPREALLAEVRRRRAIQRHCAQPDKATMKYLDALEVLASAGCPHGCRAERWCPSESQAEAAEALRILRGSR
jgi:hypothetical protein